MNNDPQTEGDLIPKLGLIKSKVKFIFIINRHHVSIEKRLKQSAPLRLGQIQDFYATYLMSTGTPTQTRREYLVHSSVSVTENYLGTMNIEELVKINSVIYQIGR